MRTDKMIPIDEVVDLLGLERDPKGMHRTDSYNVKCPFCSDRKYHMNINCEKNLYRCTRCSFDERNLNALDLYGRVRLGTRFVSGVSGNGRELARAIREEMYGTVSASIQSGSKETKSVKQHIDISPAEDKKLNAVYSALLGLDYLKLSFEHRENLIKRGLDDKSINANGYGSFYPSHTILDRNQKTYLASKKYFAENLNEVKDRYPKLKYKKDEDIIAGMLIANDLKEQGLDLNGVPGFYKLNKTWVLNLETGIIIPTRNAYGEIVCLQVRKDRAAKGLRYITISSSELKNGVNCNISRAHFPLSNSFGIDSDMPRNGRIILTEGPLKADVAAHLFTDCPVMFIAVQGVNNTRELTTIAQALKQKGVDRVYNAFDMDKICNSFVWKAERSVTQMLAKAGIESKPMFWDYDAYIAQYREELKLFLQENELCSKECENDLVYVIKNTSSLYSQSPDKYFSFKECHPWKGEKGIDDYLLKINRQ